VCSYNESKRLAERHLLFNVDELKKAAAESVNRPSSDVKGIRKFAEGCFNRIFEIFMDDGSSVLARIPYLSTSPRRLAVASEVGTLDFVRSLGIPAPQVLGYSVKDNPVGTEYILMEKLPGKPLGDAWYDLSQQELFKVLYQVVEFEAKLFNTPFPASGSIYHTRDLSPGTSKIDIPGFDGELCIGPFVGLEWWLDGRGDLDIDRGPRELLFTAPYLFIPNVS
jgi:hypothetical protein